MEFKSISIKNFRNFEEVTVDLSNKNIFFGMNDVGKTNFLYALRYVFDKEVRKNELLDSDFYQKNHICLISYSYGSYFFQNSFGVTLPFPFLSSFLLHQPVHCPYQPDLSAPWCLPCCINMKLRFSRILL